MADPIGPAEAAEVAENMLNEAAERDQQRDATIRESAAVAQVYATLAVAGRLEELTAFVRDIDVELTSIRAALENMSL